METTAARTMELARDDVDVLDVISAAMRGPKRSTSNDTMNQNMAMYFTAANYAMYKLGYLIMPKVTSKRNTGFATRGNFLSTWSGGLLGQRIPPTTERLKRKDS